MTVPLDAIWAFHHAFRTEMTALDAAAYAAARGQGDLSLVLARHELFNEFLDIHAKGEELVVFPALESVAPLVAEAYERDHRGLDAVADMLHKSVTAADPLATARATAAFQFHLSIHLTKEEAHLYRIFGERISLADQWVAIRKMSQNMPPARFPGAIQWLFPLIGPDDRENMIRIWRQELPAPVFAQVAQGIQAAIGGEWAEQVRRIPELE